MSRARSTKVDDYPQLSSDFRSLQTEYDVVVVGSGYGAGVAASRMARAGKSVAVLELGWERRPGTFPRKLSECAKDFSISGTSKNSLWNSPTKLFQLVLGEGQHAFTAHGLGGCSLINAGVYLEVDERTLQLSTWPEEIRDDPAGIQPYYSRAAEMLQPSPYPVDHPTPQKLQHLQAQSKRTNNSANFHRVPMTQFFQESRNNVGIQMQPNSASGHESTGLNDGSKNSIATTYLADAHHWGAEIFCGCEVRFIEKADDGKGYVVYFAWHSNGRSVFEDEFKNQLFWVKAKEFCFLGAGSLGTTEILLRSRNHGLPISPMVGRNMSGNGDMLIFGYNGDADINGIAGSNTGPTITGTIDNRKTGNSLGGYVIQDGCIPEALSRSLHPFLIWQTITQYPRIQVKKVYSTVKSLILGPLAAGGAMQRTATYLIMSHDSNEMTLTLDEDDMLHLRAPAEGRSQHFTAMKSRMRDLVTSTGAKIGFGYLPTSRKREDFTVHPLGGANMSRDGTGAGGVASHLGEVYTGHDSEVHPGLICCDASIIPTALGVNPLATITALAERSVQLISDKYKFSIDLETKNGCIDSNSAPKVSRKQSTTKSNSAMTSIGWQFTEVLDGYITTRADIPSYAISEEVGKESSSAMKLFLTIEVCRKYEDSTRRYEGICTGTVSCNALSNRTMKIVDGKVELFVQADDKAEATTLVYTLLLLSQEGEGYYLKGRKIVDSNMFLSPGNTWKATTTVYTRITRLDGTEIGAGIVRIRLPSLIRQMGTFRPTKGDISRYTLIPLLAFLFYFFCQIAFFFFGPLSPVQKSRRSTAGAINTKIHASTACKLTAKDGVTTIMEIYEPSSPTNNALPILFLPGVTGVGVQHSIFKLPFQSCNIVDYFLARGYRCYVLSPRWGGDANVAAQSTIYDIRLDVAAAVQYINTREATKPYVVAHCQGSVALAMALLDGTVSASQLLGVTANSVFMNQVFAYWNSLKASTMLLIRFYEFLAGNYFPIGNHHALEKNILFQRLLDVLLRFYPVHHPRDICTSPACLRTSFAFGQLWNHDNLDTHIHDNIDTFFAGTHTKLLSHVVRMGSSGGCLDSSLNSLLTEKNLARLDGLPIHFITGTQNTVFSPESTLRDYEMLRRRFGEGVYRRSLVEGYGHLDPIVGKDAEGDVFWRVGDHLEWCLQRHTSQKKDPS